MKTTIIAASLLLAGCMQPPLQEETATEPETDEVINNNGLVINNNGLVFSEIFVVDGCEYIIIKEKKGSIREYGYMAHKGNCNNPIHCYQTPVAVSDTSEAEDTIPTLIKKDRI